MLSILIISTSSLFGQREMTITEMNSDDDVVLELVGEDPTAGDFMNMNLGFNRSNEGWLRMRTDHDLSFYTNNLKRLTLTNEGDIGVGTSEPLTKLFIKNGDLGIETTTSGAVGQDESGLLKFYTGSETEATIGYCNCSADGGRLMNLNIFDEGIFLFKSDNVVRMQIDKTGEVSMDALKGAEQRSLFVDSDGTLTTEASVKFQVVSPMHFQRSDGHLIYQNSVLRASFPLVLTNFIVAESNPIIPFTKYELLEIKVWYINDSDEDMSFYIYFPDSVGHQDFTSTGANSLERSHTFFLNSIIDQEQGEYFDFSVGFREKTQEFTKAVIKYKPIY